MTDLGAPAAMDPTRLFLILLFLSHAAAQQPTTTTTQSGGAGAQPTDAAVSYRPRVAVVVGIFSIMLSVTFLLLMYAKFCYSASRADLFGDGGDPDLDGHHDGLLPPGQQQPPRSSGVDKTVIESLPFFRFSSLKGSREGLECAVCLSRFEGAELLRLLPKCKHAFHIGCVDRWLEGHSSCPLCRRRVLLEDLTFFKYSTSSRFLVRDPAAPAGETDLELYVEREPGKESGGGGSLGSSFRKMGRAVTGKETKKEILLAARGRGEGEVGGRGGRERREQFYHRFKHRIVVSDVVFKNRWSDLNSSDLVSLNSEMLRSLSSRRFPAAAMVDVAVNMEEQKSFSRPDPSNHASADETLRKIKEEIERKRSLESKASHMNIAGSPSGSDTISQGSTSTLPKSLDPSSNNRAMSEIVNISRFGDAMVRSGGDATGSSTNMEEEKVRRVWLPIARRTVQWSTAREKRSDSDKTSTAGDDIV
ncbi:hypothetical protein Taro_031177 [Colocasia esculenta]|uniref:RING-type E3 ubiquitin transferase n=1 Tax=Colocasia esculenta TaxID=4460 RepID=A0A843W5L7_COLES|nr:hypothetical protein [Colocasia esculenta]